MRRDISTIDATVATAAGKVTGVGSGMTLVGWFTASNVGMWLGILIGVAGLAVNWYFKHKSDKRAQEAHEVYMRKLGKTHDKVLSELQEANDQ